MKYPLPPSIANDVRQLAKAHIRAKLLVQQKGQALSPLQKYQQSLQKNLPVRQLKDRIAAVSRTKKTTSHQAATAASSSSSSSLTSSSASIAQPPAESYEFEDLLKAYGEQPRNHHLKSAPEAPMAGTRRRDIPVTFFQVSLARSLIGLPARARAVADSLGLRRPGQSVIRRANAATAGKIFKLKEVLHVRNLHLASMEEKRAYVATWRAQNKAPKGFVTALSQPLAF